MESKIEIQRMPIASLKGWNRNPRHISDEALDGLESSIKAFGLVEPVIWNKRTGRVVGGHQRLKILRRNNVTETDVVVVDMDKSKEMACNVALNNPAIAGIFTQDIDSILEEIKADDEELFESLILDEIDRPIALPKDLEDVEPQIDKAEELRKKWKVEIGQLWQLGAHRLICGDCTDRAVVERVLDTKPGMMVTDPPYGVSYNPQWRPDAAKEGHLSYVARRVGKVENDDRADWRDAWVLFPGDVVYSWHPAGAPSLVHAAALQDSGFVIRIQIIWAKSNFPIGRGDYHVRHEPCWYAVRKDKPSQQTDDRTQTTLWEINLDKNVDGGHSTQKPLECMERPIRNHTFDVIYDPFLGSGTTLIACERLGRKCRAVEISPAYCAVAIQRWVDITGNKPEIIN